jgi:hypothetical protein
LLLPTRSPEKSLAARKISAAGFVADMPQGRREFEAVARHRLKA